MSFILRVQNLWRAASGNPALRYRLAERLAAAIHPEAVLGHPGKYWLGNEDFRGTYERFAGTNNYRRMERVYAVDQFARLAACLPGDTAECGVYTGLCSFVICRRIAGTGKTHHGFDSFQGLSTPLPVDGDHWTEGNLSTNEETARRNLRSFPFCQIYAGWIPDLFSKVSSNRFSFVHIDVDLYQPTRDSLDF